MAFIPAIVTAVSGAVSGVASFLGGGSFLATAAKFGLGLAANFLAAKLAPKPKAQASQLDTRYGEDLARSVILGTIGTAGHHIYRNAFGKGNRLVQDVYVLSHFRITGVTRVRFKGEWHTLSATVDPAKGRRIEGIDADIWIKVYAGTMAQTADADLIAKANPAGRWTADHRLAGVAYAIVRQDLDREDLPQPWEAFFEVQGAPLYDWRQDDTAGGDGDHRWSNQATWAYSGNPMLQAYALERGVFNGTELMVGKGVPSSRLPIGNWTVAANICDELIDGHKRYSAGLIAVAGKGSTHAGNMEPLLEAAAASWIEGAGGEYPIAGANQAVVATFTDDDLLVDEDRRFSRFRPRDQLVNTVTGTFIDPESFYENKALALRIDDGALAADGERLAVSLPFAAVTSSVVADRLADIALRASRYQANGEICLRPKFLAVKPGQWVRWNSALHGDRKYQITSKSLGPLGPKAARAVYLSLQEVGDGIFDPTAYETLPPDTLIPGDADYQSELDGYSVTPITIQTETGAKRPAIRAEWDGIDDITIVAVDFEYRPTAEPTAVLTETATADQTEQRLVEGVVSLSEYEVRYRLRSLPVRTIPWTAWVPVTTPDARMGEADFYPIDFTGLTDTVNTFFEEGRSKIRATRRQVRQVAIQTINQDFANYEDKQELRRELAVQSGEDRAYFEERITLAIGPGSALAQDIEEIRAELADVASGGVIDAINIRITENEDEIESVVQRVVTLENLITDEGDFSGIDALDSRVTKTELGIEVLGVSQRAMRATIKGAALNALNQDFANYRDKLDALKATANVYQQMEAISKLQDDRLNLLASQLLVAETQLTDKIGSQSFLLLESEVEAVGDTVALHSASLTQVGIDLGTKASQLGLNSLSGTVTALGSTVTAHGTAILAVEGEVNGVSASGLFKIESFTSPGGGWSRVGAQARVSTADGFAAPSWFLDAKSDGTSRMVVVADTFVITDYSGNLAAPFVFTDGIATMQGARIGTVTFDVLASSNGKLLIKGGGSNASIEIFT